MSAQTPVDGVRPGRKDRVRAWWSLLLLPASFILAFVAGESVPASFGIDGSSDPAPWWVMAIALAVAIAVLAAPLLVTAHFAKRASVAHDQGAWTPLIVGVACVGGFALVNLVSGALVMLFG
jgi:hypothetical protein